MLTVNVPALAAPPMLLTVIEVLPPCVAFCVTDPNATVRSGTGSRVSVAVLLWSPGVGSVVALVTLAVLLSVFAVFALSTRTSTFNVTDAPAARVGTVQGTKSHSPLTTTIWPPIGNGSLMTTFCESDGPKLLTVMTKRLVSPGLTGAPAVF